jgi:hypothetical protein
LIPIRSDSAGFPKTGAKCNKLGVSKIYKSQKFSCIQKGKKLIWIKENTVNAQAPIVAPLKDWEQLRFNVQTKYVERNKVGRYFDFEFILSPTINREKAEETIQAYREASRYWTWLFDGKDTYPIIWVLLTEKDYDWWYAKVTELQGRNSIYPWDKSTNIFGHCQLSPLAFCGYGNTQIAPDGNRKLFQYNVIGSQFNSKPVANTVHHESVHFYQLANNMTLPQDIPCWYIEGQASFYGNVISGTNNSSFERNRIIKSIPDAPIWNAEDWSKFLNLMQNERNECTKDSRNYTIGSFLWEYLLLNYSEADLHKAHIELRAKTWNEVASASLKKDANLLVQEMAGHLVSVFQR